MEEKIKSFLEEKILVKKKLYHKIPYIGEKLYKKQKERKYQKNKYEMFDFIGKISLENVKYENLENEFIKQFLEENKNNYYHFKKRRKINEYLFFWTQTR